MKKLLNRTTIVMICVWVLSISVSAAKMLIPVGQVVGLELQDNTVTIASFDEALGANAQKAGFKAGDRIKEINGYPVHTTQDIRYALDRCDGTVAVTVIRNRRETTIRFAPGVTDDGPKLGLYLKQGVTGVGTVTWYDPETGLFGTLGHGVNNPRGELVKMASGTAYKASVMSVRKGECGEPGQLMGALKDSRPVGILYKNCVQGVFGKTQTGWTGEKLPVGTVKDVKTGEAKIRSTIQGETPREYSVEILKVYPNAVSSGRNILLRVTDERLLNTTGGIVQGMSGSPIIQDGKLVGAVTHVLVNDPTTGYGIFIENMLDAAA